MKFLINGYFQWIAFNTETFQFSGSGGGTYETKNGNYTETIEYFSRDDSRVGLNLKFNYDIINKEWNHMGLSSKAIQSMKYGLIENKKPQLKVEVNNVRVKGLEPPSRKALDPKSSVSTNFTTPAEWPNISKIIKIKISFSYV